MSGRAHVAAERPRVARGLADRPAFVWTFVLKDVDADTTRLVVRCRYDFPGSLGAFLTWRVLTEPAPS